MKALIVALLLGGCASPTFDADHHRRFAQKYGLPPAPGEVCAPDMTPTVDGKGTPSGGYVFDADPTTHLLSSKRLSRHVVVYDFMTCGSGETERRCFQRTDVVDRSLLPGSVRRSAVVCITKSYRVNPWDGF